MLMLMAITRATTSRLQLATARAADRGPRHRVSPAIRSVSPPCKRPPRLTAPAIWPPACSRWTGGSVTPPSTSNVWPRTHCGAVEQGRDTALLLFRRSARDRWAERANPGLPEAGRQHRACDRRGMPGGGVYRYPAWRRL